MSRVAATLGPAQLRPAVAAAVGLLWALRSAVGLASPDYVDPVTALDWIAVISFSFALAALAPGAWLIRTYSGDGRAVDLAAAALALGGLVAAFGNFVEDGLGVPTFGDVFAAGVLGVLVGLIGLTVILLLGRRWLEAALPASAFVGIMGSNEAGGGFLILVVWVGVVVLKDRQP